MLKRKELVKHSVAAMNDHFRLLLAKISAVEEKSAQFEKRLQDSNAVIASLVASAGPVKRKPGRPRKRPAPVPDKKSPVPFDAIMVDSPRRKVARSSTDPQQV